MPIVNPQPEGYAWKFEIGEPVKKIKGYAYPGIVVARCITITTAQERYLVECRVPGIEGMLHVYAPEVLETRRILFDDEYIGESR